MSAILMRCCGSSASKMLRVFREQIEPMYGRSSPLVRERIKKDVAQRFEQMDRSTPAVTERHDG
jgi:hypothetical protein